MTVLAVPITEVDSGSTFYSVFGSYHRTVVVTRYGVFMTHLHDTDPHGGNVDASLTFYTWRFLRSTDGGATWSLLYSSTNASNPPTLVADPNGVIYMVFGKLSGQTNNWDTSPATFLRFDNSNGFTAPIVTASLPNLAGGKYNLCLDWPRQQLYYSSWGRWFAVLSLSGAVLSTVRLQVNGTYATPEYPHFALDEAGVLYFACTTTPLAFPVGPPYHDIHAMKSADGGTTWTTLTGTPITLPAVCDDTGPLTLVSLPGEADQDPWLWSLIVKRGKLHGAYEVPLLSPRVQHYFRYDTATGVKDIDTTVWGGASLSFKSLSGALVSNPITQRIYAVSKNNDVTSSDTRIGALYSDDDGVTWHDYALSVSLGGPSSTQTVYSIGAAATATAWGSLFGSYTQTPNTTPKTEAFAVTGVDPLSAPLTGSVLPALALEGTAAPKLSTQGAAQPALALKGTVQAQ